LLQKHHISTIWLTSPLFNHIASTDSDTFAGLENLLVGGDVLSPAHINRVRERFSHINIINGYGPTENTTFSTTLTINDTYRDNIPIGKPIANSTAYILDRGRRPVPFYVPGELYVGGDGLARGYLNNPEKTAEVFIGNPFDTTPLQTASTGSPEPAPVPTGPRLYRTGDLVRSLADGNIQFLGRIDQQAKIRGFRVEPGEIEQNLLNIAHIKEAVATVVKKNSDSFLAVYYTADEPIQAAHIKEKLSEFLPPYMIPQYFMQLEEIPLTANGKINRAALPEPSASGTGGARPSGEIQTKLAAVWADILGMNHADIAGDDDFFLLGGHSLRA
ncbi:MAG: non-ribosomal peptide synthetase, partial [bacterium]|nr:non-ribosomal peptide synthetase [bacterium]